MSEKGLAEPAVEVPEAAIVSIMNASLHELTEALSRLDEHVLLMTDITVKERLIKAFKNCDLDCADWDDDVLGELAEIVIRALIPYIFEGSEKDD